MSLETVIQQSERNPTSWKGVEGYGGHSRERFPWEYGSPWEMWRGRIGTLLFGAFLAWLIVLFNAQTITVMGNEMLQFTGAVGPLPARAPTPKAQPFRREPAPAKSPTPVPPIAQSIGATPPRVQLGSFSSRVEAAAASEMMQQSYGTFLEGRKLTVSEAVVRQVQFYRVVIDLQSEREARDLCDAIKKEKKDCLVRTAPQPALPY